MVVLSRIMGVLTGSPANLIYFITIHDITDVTIGIDRVQCNFIAIASRIVSTVQHIRMRSRTWSTKWVIIGRGPRRIVLITQWWFPFQFFPGILARFMSFLSRIPFTFSWWWSRCLMNKVSMTDSSTLRTPRFIGSILKELKVSATPFDSNA